MITHIVLLQPKVSTTNGDITAFLESLKALQQVVPGLVSLSVGENRSTYHEGYTYGVIMHFVDEAHLQAHHSHPAHIAIVTEMNRLCQHSIDFDLIEEE